MRLEWRDELGRNWTVEAHLPDHTDRPGGVDAVLGFSSHSAAPREIPVLGPLRRALENPGEATLQHALDAAGSGIGILLADLEGDLWWVRGPEAEPFGRSWALKFSNGERELTHEGPLPDDLDALGEDELRELLDAVRGRILDPLDMKGEGEEE